MQQVKVTEESVIEPCVFREVIVKIIPPGIQLHEHVVESGVLPEDVPRFFAPPMSNILVEDKLSGTTYKLQNVPPLIVPAASREEAIAMLPDLLTEQAAAARVAFLKQLRGGVVSAAEARMQEAAKRAAQSAQATAANGTPPPPLGFNPRM